MNPHSKLFQAAMMPILEGLVKKLNLGIVTEAVFKEFISILNELHKEAELESMKKKGPISTKIKHLPKMEYFVNQILNPNIDLKTFGYCILEAKWKGKIFDN